MKNPHAQALGKTGGATGRGAAKRRTREQCQAAAQKRWQRAQELDALRIMRQQIEGLVTTDHETKADFIARVRLCLPNAEPSRET